jgi:hypothetical protein
MAISRTRKGRTGAPHVPDGGVPAGAGGGDLTIGALDVIRAGSTIGVGSLPHRNARSAAEFSFEFFDIPTMPRLPTRSPAEALVAQALIGTPGIALGQYGTIAVDVGRLDPEAAVTTDLASAGFVGFNEFLKVAQAREYSGPVKWQFVGPISVAAALQRAGATPRVAFDVALGTVRSHVQAISSVIAAALPDSPQLLILDEPYAEDVLSRDFPIPPDEAIDLVSGAMAAVESVATVGVHCGGDVDITALLASGPRLLSLRVSESLVQLSGYLERFLANDGWIIWGAVATEGPIGVSARRSTRALGSLWAELAKRGCDPERLQAQALIGPAGGLSSFTPGVAEDVCRAARAVSQAVCAAAVTTTTA